MHIHHKHTSKGKSCFYFVLFFTVHSWFCWFKQCGEMLQCPLVVAEWAVKLRGRALWLAGSSLPYINNNSYNKIKTVTKCYLCTNQDRLPRRLHKSCTSYETDFKGSVWLYLSSPSLIFNLLWRFFNYSLTSHAQYNTQQTHTHSLACIRTYTCILTHTGNSQH